MPCSGRQSGPILVLTENRIRSGPGPVASRFRFSNPVRFRRARPVRFRPHLAVAGTPYLGARVLERDLSGLRFGGPSMRAFLMPALGRKVRGLSPWPRPGAGSWTIGPESLVDS